MGVKDKGKGKAKVPKVVARDFENGGSPQTPGESSSADRIDKIAKQGSTSQTAISIPSEDEEDEDDDDFEEVAIPGASTPITPGTGTGRQGSVMDTPGTNTTAPSIDDNFDGYGDEDEEEEEGGEKDDVIRLEIGGENEEEKAKRIALAMRK
jgi:hypothetical protein